MTQTIEATRATKAYEAVHKCYVDVKCYAEANINRNDITLEDKRILRERFENMEEYYKQYSLFEDKLYLSEDAEHTNPIPEEDLNGIVREANGIAFMIFARQLARRSSDIVLTPLNKNVEFGGRGIM